MKKLCLVLMALIFAASACTSDKVGSFDQLPQDAQSIINQHFSKDSISYITIDKEVFGTEYEVVFIDGTELDFDQNGTLLMVDCGMLQVPDGLVPEQVLTYVHENYPSNYIVEWGKDDLRWKAELNSGLELIFNQQYEFVGIDD